MAQCLRGCSLATLRKVAIVLLCGLQMLYACATLGVLYDGLFSPDGSKFGIPGVSVCLLAHGMHHTQVCKGTAAAAIVSLLVTIGCAVCGLHPSALDRSCLYAARYVGGQGEVLLTAAGTTGWLFLGCFLSTRDNYVDITRYSRQDERTAILTFTWILTGLFAVQSVLAAAASHNQMGRTLRTAICCCLPGGREGGLHAGLLHGFDSPSGRKGHRGLAQP